MSMFCMHNNNAELALREDNVIKNKQQRSTVADKYTVSHAAYDNAALEDISKWE